VKAEKVQEEEKALPTISGQISPACALVGLVNIQALLPLVIKATEAGRMGKRVRRLPRPAKIGRRSGVTSTLREILRHHNDHFQPTGAGRLKMREWSECASLRTGVRGS